MRKLLGRLKDQKGQTMAEYALVVVMVVVVIALVLGTSGPFKTALDTAFAKVASTITAATT